MTVFFAEQSVTFTKNGADPVFFLENGTRERERDPDAPQGEEFIRTEHLGE